MTTGVDVPAVENIVFFRYVESSISFYQMVGRGTRLNIPTNKLMFHVYDYTNATRLFGEAFLTKISRGQGKKTSPNPKTEKEPEPSIIVEGFTVNITQLGRYILTMVDGKAIPVTVEEYKEQLTAKLVMEVPKISDFRSVWVSREERRQLLNVLPDGGRSPLVLRKLELLEDCDLYDVLAELGYGLVRRTRLERAEAFTYKHILWLNNMPESSAATVKALSAQFTKAGTEGLENSKIFQTPEVRKAGGLKALELLGKPVDVLIDIKVRLFAA